MIYFLIVFVVVHESRAGVAWGQILPRQVVWGEATDILSKENTFFFRIKTSSYGLFESNYNTNLILPLPLSMREFVYKKNETHFLYTC